MNHFSAALIVKSLESEAIKTILSFQTMNYFCLVSEYLNKRYGNKFYARAQNVAITLTRAYDVVFDTYDVILMPTLPHKPPKLPVKSATVTGTCTHAH